MTTRPPTCQTLKFRCNCADEEDVSAARRFIASFRAPVSPQVNEAMRYSLVFADVGPFANALRVTGARCSLALRL